MAKPEAGRSLTVGVTGPHDLVDRIADVGVAWARGPWRLKLTCLGYHDEHQVATELSRHLDTLDSVLFTGPLPYDLAEQAGLLRVPAATLPLSGAALYSTLLRAVLELDVDIERVSIDSLGRHEVSDAYADLNVSSRRVRVMPYKDPETAEEFFDFHHKGFVRGSSSLALTTVRSVAERLAKADVPVLRMVPTAATIKTGLTQAVLMAVGNRLEGAQAAICIVEVMPTSRTSRLDDVYWHEDLRLAAQRILLHDARAMGAFVMPRDQSSFTIVVTLGPLVEATQDFLVVPFVERLAKELGVDARVGIGLGQTLRVADRHAQEALATAQSGTDSPPSVIGPHGAGRLFSTGPSDPTGPDENPRTRELFDQLLAALEAGGSQPAMALDAEQVADLLGVTPRTARRSLQSMADLGMVWPLPPQRSQGRGRPRQRYRLVAPDKVAE